MVNLENSNLVRKTFVYPEEIEFKMLGLKILRAPVTLTSTLFTNKRKILMWLGYGALIAFALWFVTGLVSDYFSHIGVDTPLFS
jgi:hypothetical protein